MAGTSKLVRLLTCVRWIRYRGAMTEITPALPRLDALPRHQRAAVTHLLFDVDDTLTLRGALPEPAARALYRAQEAGLALVAVTGRSAAWAEMLVRLFPLQAAVAETGALCLWRDPAGRVRELHSEPDSAVREANARRRQEAAQRVLAEVDQARLALDNRGRAYDVAFDLIEEGLPVDEAAAARIRQMLQAQGLAVAQSSVHINAWFGSFDKATMVERYLQEVGGTSLEALGGALLYVGDSPNDGAMFARAGIAVGVANVAPHLPVLRARGQCPHYLTHAEGGAGFAELVDALLSARDPAAQR